MRSDSWTFSPPKMVPTVQYNMVSIVSVTYCIAGKFRGRNNSSSLRFRSYLQKFSLQNSGCTCTISICTTCIYHSVKVFSSKCSLKCTTNPWKFSPSKTSCYTVRSYSLKVCVYTCVHPYIHAAAVHLSKQWDGCPFGLGLAVEDKPTEFSWSVCK